MLTLLPPVPVLPPYPPPVRPPLAAGDRSAYTSLAMVATTNKENVLSDLRALSQAARQLQPLLDKAQQLRWHKKALPSKADGEPKPLACPDPTLLDPRP